MLQGLFVCLVQNDETLMKNPKNGLYEIKNNTSGSVDVLLYGSIPDMDWDEWREINLADKFVKEFNRLEQEYERINIRINSPGGSLYHSFPMYNAIARSKKAYTYNDGIAYSAGGYILMAGQNRYAAKNSMIMLHAASGVAVGNAKAMREVADMLDKYDSILSETFAEKTGMSVKQVRDVYFDGRDHFFTAQEALEMGLIDEIEDRVVGMPDQPTDLSAVMNSFRNKREETLTERILEKVRNIFPAAKPQAVAAKPDPEPQPEKDTHMDFSQTLALLDKEQLGAEDVAAIRKEIEQYTGDNEKYTRAELDTRVAEAVAAKEKAHTTTVAELQAQINDLKKQIESETAPAKEGTDKIARTDDAADNFLTSVDLEVRNMLGLS